MNQNPPVVYSPDTNILVHHARNSSLYQRIAAQFGLLSNNSKPLLSVVALGEIKSLTEQLGWGNARKQRVDDFIAQCAIVQLNYPGLIEAYVAADVESRRVGRKMGDNDLWIAATARVMGAILLTTDKDFDHLHPTFIVREWIDPTTP